MPKHWKSRFLKKSTGLKCLACTPKIAHPTKIWEVHFVLPGDTENFPL